MDDSRQLSDVQLLNFLGLQVLQREVARDPAIACYTFRMPVSTIPMVQGLSQAKLSHLVNCLDYQCVFQIRPELLACADTPPALTALLAMARSPYAP